MHYILLVDDDHSFRRSLAIQLEFEGYQVSEVSSVKQAVRLLDQCRKHGHLPDLVVSDVRMPELSRDDFILGLEEQFPRLPVLILSAFEIPDRLKRYPFLRKPFNINQMVNFIEQLMDGHQ